MATKAVRNAFAPEPVNALIQAQQQPEFGNIMSFLGARGSVPQVRFSDYGNPKFSTNNLLYGGDLPAAGVVSLPPTSDANAVMHEFTHAADRQIGQLSLEIGNKPARKRTPLENQFMAAYDKLRYSAQAFNTDPAKLPREQMASRLGPEWAAKNKDYRAQVGELSAWGMGNMAGPGPERPAPLHLDPTMATEFSILLELANRLQQQRKE